MNADHRLAELRGLVGMPGQVIEDVHPENLVHGRLAGFEGVLERSEGLPGPRAGHGEHGRANRPRGLFPQSRPQIGEFERVIVAMGEDAEARERAHEAMQRARVRSHGFGDVGGRLRAVRQVVGQADLRGGVHEARKPEGRAHLDHRDVRGNCGCRIFHLDAHCLRRRVWHDRQGFAGRNFWR